MDAKARLGQMIRAAYEKWNRGEAVAAWAEPIADALLAAGVTPPPQPAGPVTSEEASVAFKAALYKLNPRVKLYCDEVRRTIDAAMPLLARDHGLLTRAEVERRARAWADGWGYSGAVKGDLVEALTSKDERNGNV